VVYPWLLFRTGHFNGKRPKVNVHDRYEIQFEGEEQKIDCKQLEVSSFAVLFKLGIPKQELD
jgi:hypothetical protein